MVYNLCLNFISEGEYTMTNSTFEWAELGDIKRGRPNLGSYADIHVYRLMQFSIKNMLIKNFGRIKADEIFYEAGLEAGRVFYERFIEKKDNLTELLKDLELKLIRLKVGILRIEEVDIENSKFIVTIEEDLDCSGLPVSDDVICSFDEGFIAGIFSEHTGSEFQAKEVDCWCSGARVCRFVINEKS